MRKKEDFFRKHRNDHKNNDEEFQELRKAILDRGREKN